MNNSGYVFKRILVFSFAITASLYSVNTIELSPGHGVLISANEASVDVVFKDSKSTLGVVCSMKYRDGSHKVFMTNYGSDDCDKHSNKIQAFCEELKKQKKGHLVKHMLIKGFISNPNEGFNPDSVCLFSFDEKELNKKQEDILDLKYKQYCLKSLFSIPEEIFKNYLQERPSVDIKVYSGRSDIIQRIG